MSKRCGVIALWLAGALVAALPVWAQEGEDAPNPEFSPVPAPAPETETIPVPEPVPPPEAEVAPAVEQPSPHSPQSDALIQENLDQALANYEDLLAKAPEEAKKVIRERIRANEELLARYKKGLSDSRESLRTLRIKIATRAGKEHLERLSLAESMVDLEYEANAAESDVVFFEREVAETEARLARLREWARIHGVELDEPVVAVEKKSPVEPKQPEPTVRVPAAPAPPPAYREPERVEAPRPSRRSTTWDEAEARPSSRSVRTVYHCPTCGQMVEIERNAHEDSASIRRTYHVPVCPDPPVQQWTYHNQYYGTCPPPPPPAAYYWERRWR